MRKETEHSFSCQFCVCLDQVNSKNNADVAEHSYWHIFDKIYENDYSFHPLYLDILVSKTRKGESD